MVKRLALESVVIILSILAAFALDTWWDSRQERREERETLEALRSEFSAARVNILFYFYRSLQERILGSVEAVGDSLHKAYLEGRRAVSLPDTALGSWGIALAELAEEESDSRAYVYSDLHQVLRTRMDTYGLWAAASGLFNGTLSPEGMAGTRRVPVDTEVVGVFDLRASLLRHGIEEFDPLIAEVDAILMLIDRALGVPGIGTDPAHPQSH